MKNFIIDLQVITVAKIRNLQKELFFPKLLTNISGYISQYKSGKQLY